jgi:serine O-acetyltransferase
VGLVESAAGYVGAVDWHALRLYRLSHWLWIRGHRGSALLVTALNRVLTGVDIMPAAEFGPGLLIMHGHGTVVGAIRGGRNCVIYHGVTLGARAADGGYPSLGDRVNVFPGAKVLGPVTLGDDARIGANAVVIHDVPAGATVTAPLGRMG